MPKAASRLGGKPIAIGDIRAPVFVVGTETDHIAPGVRSTKSTAAMFDRQKTASMIENRTFDEIAVGDSASLSRTMSQQDIDLFAVISGDVNLAHMDPAYAETEMFHKLAPFETGGFVVRDGRKLIITDRRRSVVRPAQPSTATSTQPLVQ